MEKKFNRANKVTQDHIKGEIIISDKNIPIEHTITKPILGGR